MTDWVEALGNARIQFWACPIPAHEDRKDDKGRLVGTVEWRGDVAYCTAPDCGRTSADPASEGDAPVAAKPTQPTYTEAEAKALNLLGWNLRCNRCGTFGAQWVPGERPGWYFGNLALCPPHRQELADVRERHERELAEVRQVNFEQPIRTLPRARSEHLRRHAARRTPTNGAPE